jgi:hypothetical protein
LSLYSSSVLGNDGLTATSSTLTISASVSLMFPLESAFISVKNFFHVEVLI